MCDLEHVTRCTWHGWSEGQAACSAGCSVVAVGELGRFGEGWQRLGPSLVASLSQNRDGFIQEAMHVCLSPQLHYLSTCCLLCFQKAADKPFVAALETLDSAAFQGVAGAPLCGLES